MGYNLLFPLVVQSDQMVVGFAQYVLLNKLFYLSRMTSLMVNRITALSPSLGTTNSTSFLSFFYFFFICTFFFFLAYYQSSHLRAAMSYFFLSTFPLNTLYQTEKLILYL